MPGGLFRNHPFLVATSAASGGVLLGAYVAFQVFSAPVEQRPAAQTNETATVTKPALASETTGSAPALDDVSAGDRCNGQTWPNFTRDCMQQMRSRKPARTVTADRVEQPTSATQTVAPAIAVAPPIAAVPADKQPLASPPSVVEPVAASSNQPAANAKPDAQSTAAKSANGKSRHARSADAKSSDEKSSDVKSANVESAKENAAKEAKATKRKIKEAKRKARKPKNEESDSGAFAFAPGGDRDDAWGDRADRNDGRRLRAESRSDRSRRVIVRQDDEDGDRLAGPDGRRMIVIRRGRDGGDNEGGGFGGLFGGLFGD